MYLPLTESQLYEVLTAFLLSFIIGLAFMRFRWFSALLLFLSALSCISLFLLFGINDLSVIAKHIASKILGTSVMAAIASLCGGLLAAVLHNIRRRKNIEDR